MKTSRTVRSLIGSCGVVAALLLGASAGGGAESPRGFLRAATADALRNEARLLATIDTASVGSFARQIAATTRVAGTPEAARTADWIDSRMRGWGLPTRRHEYDVFLPHARRAQAWLQGGRALSLTPGVDEAEAGGGSYSAAAGYSAAGDVTGAVVYANYGRAEDFAALRAGGVPAAGAVVLVRYGELFRGAKVRNAEMAGAAAVLLFSDPAEDGFARGSVWPAGPFRPATSLQRGSVKVGIAGDPMTPGWAARAGAPHRPPPVEVGLPGIPAVAIGSGAAAQVMAAMGGPEVPAGWNGSLPVAYRVGDLESATVRVQVELDAEPVKRIRNVVAEIRGSQEPDSWVILGAHFDSWTTGATDNASGVAALLEVARALAALRDAGISPRRSIVLAAWDAEEWGLLGSGEWVEDLEGPLGGAVAYLNLDGIAGGPYFHIESSPSLARTLRAAAAIVPDPVDPAISVWEGRQRRSAPGPATIDLPGGGSDHASFSSRLGVPVASFGFVGAAGVYHSVNDSTEYMERFGDPGYRQHAAAAAVAAIAAWQLADADLLPLDPAATARLVRSALDSLSEHGQRELEAEPLRRVTDRLMRAALDFERIAGATLRGGDANPAVLRAASRQLLRAEQRFVASDGLPGDAWQRNRLFAPHPDDAYAVAVLPAVAGRVRDGDLPGARLQVADLVRRVLDAAQDVEAASRLLLGSSTRVAVP